METLIIVFILVLVIYLLSKNSKSITEEATLTRARQTEDYQKLYDNIYQFNEHYKEFDKLIRLLRKDIKSLNMVTDDLTTALNMKNNKKHNEQFYKELIKSGAIFFDLPNRESINFLFHMLLFPFLLKNRLFGHILLLFLFLFHQNHPLNFVNDAPVHEI